MLKQHSATSCKRHEIHDEASASDILYRFETTSLYMYCTKLAICAGHEDINNSGKLSQSPAFNAASDQPTSVSQLSARRHRHRDAELFREFRQLIFVLFVPLDRFVTTELQVFDLLEKLWPKVRQFFLSLQCTS